MIGSCPSRTIEFAPIVFMLTFLCVFACACGDKVKPKNDPVPEPQPAQKDARAVAIDAGARSLPPLPEEFVDVGVSACDDYIKRQRTCVEEHAPKGIRKPQLAGLRAVAAKWAEAAVAGRKTQLAQTCVHMIAASKQATMAWGCKW